jgi:hypothetical protein
MENLSELLGLEELVVPPQTQTERYKQLEEKAFNHVAFVQNALDDTLSAGELSDLRLYTSAIKDLTSTYNDMSRQRQMAEIQEGQLLPMNILERYKNEFYPRIMKGVDELRINIENLLPPSMVPEFKSAWNRSYKKYTDATKEAEAALNDYKIIAQEEALFMAHQKDNNRLIASKAVTERIKEEKRKKHNEKEAQNRKRAKEKKQK